MTHRSKGMSLFGALRQAITAVLIALVLPAAVAADTRNTAHVLPIGELRADVARANAEHQANRAAIDRFFSSDRVVSTLQASGMAPDRIRASVSLLNERELADLAARVNSAEAQIVGGELTNAQVTLVILAITVFAYMALLILAFK